MQAVHVAVHTPEQVKAIVAEAMAIADDFDRDSLAWVHAFNGAVSLLGQRATAFVQPQALPLDLTGFGSRKAS